jgi:ferric-dicitrate binding protein FerR (iron transport regulator)
LLEEDFGGRREEVERLAQEYRLRVRDHRVLLELEEGEPQRCLLSATGKAFIDEHRRSKIESRY